MIPDAFRLRRAVVAYVFSGQPEIRREEALQFYDRVTGEKVDVPQFNFERSTLSLARVGSGDRAPTFQAEVGPHEGNFRLLIVETWPDRALELIKQDADIIWEKFQKTWPENRVGGRPVVVETRFRLDVPAEGGDATEYLVDDVLHLPHKAIEELGRSVHGMGLKINIPVEASFDETGEGADTPLNFADSRIRIETLLDDTSRLYLEMVNKWPSVPLPAEARQQHGQDLPTRINPEPRRPSEYLDDSYRYLTGRVANFVTTAAEG